MRTLDRSSSSSATLCISTSKTYAKLLALIRSLVEGCARNEINRAVKMEKWTKETRRRNHADRCGYLSPASLK